MSQIIKGFCSYWEEVIIFTAVRKEPLETSNIMNNVLQENIKVIFKNVVILWKKNYWRKGEKDCRLGFYCSSPKPLYLAYAEKDVIQGSRCLKIIGSARGVSCRPNFQKYSYDI